MKHRCPICQKIIKASSQEQPEQAKFFPFCSRRCKLIDLGLWLDSEYRIISDLKSRKTAEPSNSTNDKQ